MRKTLVLTHEYYPFRGGVARYCYNLFKFLPKDKYLVLTDNPQVKTKDNIINGKLSYPFIKPSWLFSYFKLKNIIKKNKIELIFTPNILPLGSLAYFLKIPYIISLHGLDINLALKNKRNLTIKILQAAKYILVNSQSTKAALDGLSLDNNKIKPVYPALDFDTSYDQKKLEAYKNKFSIKDQKVLLTVGRLNRRKGQDIVIEAIKELKDDFDLKYFIVGRGEEKEKLQKMIADNNLSDRVYIFDNIDDEDLIYFYKLADIFVMPHRQEGNDIEGFGIVFLEAAKMKLAVIAGASGGVKEIFSEDRQAILLPESNTKNLIKALRSLLNNPEQAAKLGEAAFSRTADFKGAKEQSDIFKKLLI